MSRHTIYHTLLAAVCLLSLGLSSCCRGPQSCSTGCVPDDVEDPYLIRSGNLRLTGILKGNALQAGARWHDRDAIGVTALLDSKVQVSNVKYTTMASLGGHFVAAKSGIRLPEGKSYELIAYYPYTEELADGEYLPLTTTSALYLSRPVTGVAADQTETVLEFYPVLSSLKISLSGVDLSGARLELMGLALSGMVSVRDGSVTIGEKKGSSTASITTDGPLSGSADLHLLPGQSLKGMTLRIFTREYVFTFPITQEIMLKSGTQTTIELKLTDGGDATSDKITTSEGTILPMPDVIIDAGTI